MLPYDQNILKVLIQVFEASTQVVCGIDDTRLSGITSWKIREVMKGMQPNLLHDWIHQVGYSKLFESTVDGITQYVQLSVDLSDQRRAHYRCDQSVAIHTIPLSDAAVYRLDEYRFFQYITSHLDIRPNDSQPFNTCIPNLFWQLGQVEFDSGEELPVYLARNIHTSYSDVIKVLFEQQCFGVLLYTGEDIPDYVTFPSGIYALPLLDTMLDGRIRDNILEPWVNPNTPLLSSTAATSKKPPPNKINESIITIKNSLGEAVLFYDQADKILSIPGKEHWRIKGTRQIAIVEYLIEKSLQGIHELRSKEILSNTQSREYGGATRIPSIFNGSARWRDYIKNTRYGYWGLNVTK